MVFGFSKFKTKKKEPSSENISVDETATSVEKPTLIEPALTIESLQNSSQSPKQNWFSRLTQGLKKTRTQFSEGISALVLGKKQIDEEVLEELETTLLCADVGVEVTERLLEHVKKLVDRKELGDISTLQEVLKQELKNILAPCQVPLILETKPFVILTVGVNGAGKTTTIAKLAHYFQNQTKRVMLAAGDTYRAAAIEQLKMWGERNQAPVIAQHQGADSASVIFDAMQAAIARQFEVLIADTAGRLHTQAHLMAELSKIKRVLGKLNEKAPQEVMLVIDATTGQNALRQVELFHETIGLTGLVITKLDGTAKAGIIFAIAEKTRLPIRFIGVGEQLNDLKPFDHELFVEALFSELDAK